MFSKETFSLSPTEKRYITTSKRTGLVWDLNAHLRSHVLSWEILKELTLTLSLITNPNLWYWLRFIDDIFAIWTHGSAKLLDFNTWLNSRHNSLNFTCSHSETSVVFLDTPVKLNCGLLETELYIKPTSSLSYLHRTSSHPTHVFKSLPYGEFLRVHRNCTHLAPLTILLKYYSKPS